MCPPHVKPVRLHRHHTNLPLAEGPRSWHRGITAVMLNFVSEYAGQGLTTVVTVDDRYTTVTPSRPNRHRSTSRCRC